MSQKGLINRMDHDDEAQLIEDILDGEAEAYAVLVRRYQGPIYALMTRMCKNIEDASDLTQETFVVAYEKMDRFKNGSRFFPWLYTIGLNIGRDYLRKRGRAEVSSCDLPDGFIENLSSESSTDEVINGIDSGLILNAMDALGIGTREALMLRYQQGMSIKDISGVLGISVSSVKMKISRGLDKLRVIFVHIKNGPSL